jgi:transposase
LTGGQINDCTQAIALLGERKAEAVLADKGYDADAIVEHIEAMGGTAVIPPNLLDGTLSGKFHLFRAGSVIQYANLVACS